MCASIFKGENQIIDKNTKLFILYKMLSKYKVYEITRKIPKGKVATYKQIASLAGNPNASRFVGMCMRTNPDIPATPCHRVVGVDGAMHGYSAKGGIALKIQMLKKEGVYFRDDKVDLSKSQWNGILIN